MARVYNFSAGPAVLPEEVLKEAAEEMLDYRGTGMSVMEMSHRSKAFQQIIDEAEQDIRDLMNIPDNYKVLFLQGGASQQFAAVPMNLKKNGKAAYIITGQWAKKAAQEAEKYVDVQRVASSADKTFSYIPDCSDLDIDDDVDYVYICENNTIYGTKYHTLPNTKGHTLVADVSSCFLSEPVDVEKYGVIYGGVQKNVGPAGVVIAIVREDLIPEEDTVIVMTNLGYIKRMTVDNFKAQNRGGKGIKGMQTVNDDFMKDMFMVSTHDYILFLTNTGRIYKLKGYEIPEAGRTARGMAIVNLLQLQPGEKISAMVQMREFEDDKYLIMATKNGTIKKTPINAYTNIRKSGIQAITLREGDELIDVTISDNTHNIMLVTKNGQGIKFRETDVRETGRSAMGVRGIELKGNDEVISMQIDTEGEYILIVSANGMGKRTPFTEFKLQNRGGKGVKCYKITEKTGEVVGAKAVNDGNEIMMITNEGIVIRMFVDDISVLGRVTLGVKLMNTGNKDDIVVASITKVKESVTQADAEEAERLEAENSEETDEENSENE